MNGGFGCSPLSLSTFPPSLNHVQRVAQAGVDTEGVENHHSLITVGPTGVRKTSLACALSHSAIKDGHSAPYVRVPRLLDELSVARANGRLARMMATLARTSILRLDDLLLRPVKNDQAADLLEVVEDRRGRSIIATSQLPVSHWHEGMGDATIADAILDRLLQRTHRIEPTGTSRQQRDTTTGEGTEVK
ncbi:MAG: ATP-binding protein [Acidimicrobiales bacterium]